MIDLLAQIKDFAATAVALLTVIPLLLLARELTIDWAKKLIYVAIIAGIWNVFVQPYADDIKTLVICILTIFPYKVITEDTASFLNQVFLFSVTFKLFKWMFKVENPSNNGFTSRNLK